MNDPLFAEFARGWHRSRWKHNLTKRMPAGEIITVFKRDGMFRFSVFHNNDAVEFSKDSYSKAVDAKRELFKRFEGSLSHAA